MSATKQEIREWLQKGIERNATHVIIALDTWDHENYPIYVNGAANVREKIMYYRSSQDRIDEVYSLSVDIEKQLSQERAWNI